MLVENCAKKITHNAVDTAITLRQPQSNLQRLAGTWGGAFACTCGTSGGFLAGHAGCLVAPILVFATAASGTSLGVLSVVTSFSLIIAGLGVWRFTRGKVAGKIEKFLTYGGAVVGAAMFLVLHFSGAIGNQHNVESAIEWYLAQPPDEIKIHSENAKIYGESLLDYILTFCLSPSDIAALTPSDI